MYVQFHWSLQGSTYAITMCSVSIASTLLYSILDRTSLFDISCFLFIFNFSHFLWDEKVIFLEIHVMFLYVLLTTILFYYLFFGILGKLPPRKLLPELSYRKLPQESASAPSTTKNCSNSFSVHTPYIDT